MKKKSVTKKADIPPKLTEYEYNRMESCMFLEDWHFDVLFIKNENITFIQQFTVNYSNSKKVQLYGLNAVIVETKQQAIANFFLRCDKEVYQSLYVDNLLEIVEIIRKYERRNDYEEDQKKEKKQLKAVA